MSTIFRSAGEVRFLFEQIRNGTPAEVHNQIRAMATEGPELKRKQYPDTAYLDQIEKNAVYLREGTMTVNAAIVEYLLHGKPILNPEQVADFVTLTSVTRPQQTTLLHLNFIRYGCLGCYVHEEHGPYAAFREILLAGDLPKYINEMEFSYVYFQASCMVAQQCLIVFLQNRRLAGSARLISSTELAEVVRERVFIWTDLCLGRLQFVGPVGHQQSTQ